MKRKWIWIGAAGLILVAVVLSKSFGGSKDVLNADGIRDDVAIAIQEAVPHSKKIRAAAIQSARVLQMAVDNPDNAVEIHRLDEDATSCMYAVSDESRTNEDTSLILKIEAMVVNSYQRSRAYIRYNSKLSGRVFHSIQPDSSRCDFDVDAMDN